MMRTLSTSVLFINQAFLTAPCLPANAPEGKNRNRADIIPNYQGRRKPFHDPIHAKSIAYPSPRYVALQTYCTAVWEKRSSQNA